MTEYRSAVIPRPTTLGVFALVLGFLMVAPLVIFEGGEPVALYLPAGILVVLLGEGAHAVWRIRGADATVAAPAEVDANEPFPFELQATRPLPGMRVRMVPMSERATLVDDEPVQLVHPGVRHGLFPHAVLELQWVGILGLTRASRAIVVACDPPVASAPRADRVVDAVQLLENDHEHGWRESPWQVRGVRPYEAGDPRQRVHWRASARHGSLLVRDPQRIGEGTAHVVLAMTTEHEHSALAVCRSVVEGLLARGYTVTLTARQRGPRQLHSLEYAGLVYSSYWPGKGSAKALTPKSRAEELAMWAAGELVTEQVGSRHDLVRRLSMVIADPAPPIGPGMLVVDGTGVRRG